MTVPFFSFFLDFFWVSTEVVYLQRCFVVTWLVHHVTSLHAKPHSVGACVFSCNPPPCTFGQKDRDLLHAIVVTRGWNGYRNKSQHRKLERKFLPPLLPGLEPATFQSRVRHSNHWGIRASRGWRNGSATATTERYWYWAYINSICSFALEESRSRLFICKWRSGTLKYSYCLMTYNTLVIHSFVNEKQKLSHCLSWLVHCWPKINDKIDIKGTWKETRVEEKKKGQLSYTVGVYIVCCKHRTKRMFSLSVKEQGQRTYRN